MAVISHPRMAYNGHILNVLLFFYFLNYLSKKTIFWFAQKKSILIHVESIFT